MRLLFILLFGFSTVEAGTIYKCSDKWGKPIFSDKPCIGEKGVEAKFEAKQPQRTGAAYSPEDTKRFTEIRRKRRVDKLKSNIKQYERDIRNYHRSMDSEIARLKREQRYANNNLAGAQYLTSLANEMQAISKKYDALITARSSNIDRSQKELDRLSGTPKGG